MNTKELSEIIRNKGFHSIRIEGEADKDNFREENFVSDLDEFFAAAKVLEAKVIFLISSSLHKEHFLYESEFDEQFHSSDAEDEEIDLAVVRPSLLSYKKYIDKECSFVLLAKGGIADVGCYLEEDWWDAFCEECETAMEKIEEDRESAIEKMEEQRENKSKEFAKLIKGLISDSEFLRLPTQRGMKAYALEKYPELEEMDEDMFVKEIRAISDKIAAKGLRRKSK
ncbi:MAG TPA: hypothetical protein VGH91_06005 [Gammaproteobacteria bacterium]|jgi:hypothetical protein